MPDEDEPPEDLAEPVYVTGWRRRIYAYREASGRVRALDELESLPQNVQEVYAVRFQQMGNGGPQALRHDHFHWWKGEAARGMGAFGDLRSKTRIPCFREGEGNIFLTHVISGKKENSLDPRVVRETERIRAEYVARRARIMQGAMGRKEGSR